MTRTVNITEAKAQFYRLAEAASRGEEIIITKRGRVRARLIPLEPPKAKKPKSRRGESVLRSG
jgi:prevent-host-death family protein